MINFQFRVYTTAKNNENATCKHITFRTEGCQKRYKKKDLSTYAGCSVVILLFQVVWGLRDRFGKNN